MRLVYIVTYMHTLQVVVLLYTVQYYIEDSGTAPLFQAMDIWKQV